LVLFVFALTLFVSASLLFLIEPMVGKMITPLLGGTPAVWNTCMVFFQAALLAGYAYAHATTAWLGARKQAVLQLVLLGLAFLFLQRLHIDRSLVSSDVENPIPSLLWLLTTTIGVPFFVVSSSAPVLQKWFASTNNPAARDPYFLYGASNFGSMLALLGYPAAVEPFFTVANQRIYWVWGYAVLVLLTAGCAAFLWLSPPAPSAPPRKDEWDEPPTEGEPETLSGTVSGWRRFRWVLLAAVPSSLMLGATTYITTDIAAIPLLWVLPLALYLLSFIIVFAKIPVWLQNAIVFLEANTVVGCLFGFAWSLLEWSDKSSWPSKIPLPAMLFILIGATGWIAAFLIFLNRRSDVLHRGHILVLPLIVLVILAMTLSDIKPKKVEYTIAMHLAALFVVAMVCHGELARDRPSTAHLTEYFLWMSFGGVVGGMFNALAAPLMFNTIAEYQIAMLAACLLLPPLTPESDDTTAGVTTDVGLALAFAVTGLVLLVLRIRDANIDLDLVKPQTLLWPVVALLAGLAYGGAAALRERRHPAPAWIDLILPVSLGVLVLGLVFGVASHALDPRIKKLSEWTHLPMYQIRPIISFWIPAVLCYTFVERPRRFGLSVGALLLAGSIGAAIEEPPLLQRRSFFGVLKVEKGNYNEDIEFHTLTHGTTMHGKQFRKDELHGKPFTPIDFLYCGWRPSFFLDELRATPVTYYAPTGPVGHVMKAYNQADRPVGVIGLGTGSMATYALPGQTMTFYDIDAVVRDISFSTADWFSFVADAKRRGAKISPLVLGDARLTLDRNDLKGDDKYGILVIDAFSSDAIPVHLITLEAMQMYLRKLRDDGLILFHISNRHLDLKPVLANLAQATDPKLVAYVMEDWTEKELGKSASTWVVLARKTEDVSRLLIDDRWDWEQGQELSDLRLLGAFPDGGAGLSGMMLMLQGVLKKTEAPWVRLETNPKVGVWTDDFSNILSVFMW
jgi:hypothetical protein